MELTEDTEKRTVVQDVPVDNRVVETLGNSVVNERRGMSGVAVAALVVAAITAAVVITMMIVNSQQRNSDDALAQERARTVEAQQALAQPAQQPPIIINIPPSQPATGAIPNSVAGPPGLRQFTRFEPSNTSIEIDVTSRLQNDQLLRPYAVNVKVTGGTATLSGNVPDQDLKKRAEKLAGAVNAVQSVVNDIAVRP
jgi:hypothetical protein